jgi:hypothetical protein
LALKGRIEKMEKAGRPKRQAVFVLKEGGRARGHALYRDGLKWENLSEIELQQLTADLEAEGIEVIIIHVRSV